MEKVAEAELAANQGVIVERPPSMGGTGDDDDSGTVAGSPFPPVPENHYGITICFACHEVIPEPAWPSSHVDYSDNQCFECHQQLAPIEGGSDE